MGTLSATQRWLYPSIVGVACLNVLDFRDPARARLTVFNDTSHYAESLSGIPAEPAARLSKWWDKPNGPG